MNKIPVLMYHSIQGRDNDGTGCNYEIKEKDFVDQMHFLVENGFSSLLFDDLISSNKIPEKSVVITFDDGHLSNYTIAFPILLNLGLKAEFFITIDQVNHNNRMNVNQLREMLDNGMGIGSHGLTHTYLDNLLDTEAKKELQQSKRHLSDMLGKPVYTFSAPGGRFRARHVKMAKKCGYRVFCTSKPGFIMPGISLLTVPRIPIFQGNLTNFSKIIFCDEVFYFKKRVVYFILGLAKTILGNSRYESIRSFILRD